MAVLETERLKLRPWTRRDACDFYDYARRPEVGPAAGWMPHKSIDETIRIIEDCFLYNQFAWAMELRATGKVVGGINLRNDSKRGEYLGYTLGFSMSPDYWGQGLMPEAGAAVIRHAFDNIHIHLLSVFHYPHNIRSKRVIEKLGFKYEGRLRNAAKLDDGSIFDELCYSMIRSEYNALYKHQSQEGRGHGL
ncbi:MAG: GNAT family N-acetyltransferase [Victivallales bacterium]|nr:GNAT family N-acetyltransferase [Victivallales bacterium]